MLKLASLVFLLITSTTSFSANPPATNSDPAKPATPPTAPIGPVDNKLSKEQLDNLKVPVIVSAEVKARLASPLTGFIDKVYVKTGSSFKKGDPLIDFECTVLKAEKEKAKIALDTTKKKSEGMDRLLRLDGANQMDVSDAKGKYLDAEQKLTIKTYMVDKCNLTAPFDGQVIALNVSEHEYIEQGKPLMDTVSFNDLELSLILPSDWLSWLKIGTQFSVQLNETPKMYQAKINRFVYSIDPVSKTITAFGSFTNSDDMVKPGMSGNAQFER